MTPKQDLRDAVQRFRVWAEQAFPANRWGEWETEYEDWESLHLASSAVIQSDPDSWDSETMHLLLYAIARDNEVGFIVSRLKDSQAIKLASLSMTEGEPDARWQLAVHLGKFPVTRETEQLLLGFARDSEEYVRRRAIMVLADVGCQSAEPFAVAAWNSGDEYQRMAALHIFQRLNSPRLEQYLALAATDGHHPYLAKMANRIRCGLPGE